MVVTVFTICNQQATQTESSHFCKFIGLDLSVVVGVCRNTALVILAHLILCCIISPHHNIFHNCVSTHTHPPRHRLWSIYFIEQECNMITELSAILYSFTTSALSGMLFCISRTITTEGLLYLKICGFYYITINLPIISYICSSSKK